MGLPGWALVALIGVPLAQIPLVLFLSRWFELDGESPAPTPGSAYWTEDSGGSRPTVPAHSRGVCRRCGALNDPTFTYCGDCVTRL